MRLVSETDLGVGLDRFPARKAPDLDLVLLEGPVAWTNVDLSKHPCPVCAGRPLRRTEVCLYCDRGLEWMALPGLPIQDPEPPRGKLRGGRAA